MEKQTYYLGLDMGTNSVGWAVTDEKYQILRKKGKDLWGVREFNEAETAVNRRTKRIARRRRQREQVRIGLLKSYFDEEIRKTDPNFFARLDNSKFLFEDKDDNAKSKYALFDDKEYSDKTYFAEYPTIFHLRKALLDDAVPADERYARKVYLALLNMFKHRGHFLNSSLSVDDDSLSVKDSWDNLRRIVEESFEFNLLDIDVNALEEILADNRNSRSVKRDRIAELLHLEKPGRNADEISRNTYDKSIEIVKGLVGLKMNLNTLFSLEIEEKVTIEFSDFNYEDKRDEIEEQIGTENQDVLDAVKGVFDAGCLLNVLKGKSFLSEARVEEYQKHKEDLASLKRLLIQEHKDQEFEFLFRSSEPGSYSAYVDSVNSGKKQRRVSAEAPAEKQKNLYKKILEILGPISDDNEVKQTIKKDIETGTFLPKQLTPGNGVIPNQVHGRELKQILKNAEKHLPFLQVKDETGYSISEKIQQLFSFQIPYYVGPTSLLSAKNHGTGWVVRNEGEESGAVLPWNIEKKINLAKTSEEFVKRLIRECTYIRGEKVLPKDSLLYQKFVVLNEINCLSINGERLPVEIKQEFYNDKLSQGKRLTKKQVAAYFHQKGLLESEEELSGMDNQLNNSLSTYHTLVSILGDELKTDSGKQKAEEIVQLCTIYGDAKKFLKEGLKAKFPEIPEDQMKRILGLKFKDWGRLSREFLEMPGVNKETGELTSLINAMWETNNNLQELLHSDNFTFAEELASRTQKGISTIAAITPETLDEYYFSAPVKRMIWQTLLVITEISKVMGAEPEKVFIEMTRSDEEKGDKGRKSSRQKQLIGLYKNIRSDYDWVGELGRLSEDNLRSKKVYLYYTQMGKDMYSGEPINLDRIENYDIDHIYPRHFVKDDSIHNNLVLVNKSANNHKSDKYPIEADIQNRCRNLWNMLHQNKLITDEKYRRLIGTREFSEEQQADFIARQMVETGQATKGVADILKQVFPSSRIVYAKAGNVSDFRKDFDLLKSRLVNEFHHAQDAYLNIVVGNVYLTKFTDSPRNFIKEYRKNPQKNAYTLGKMFKSYDVIRDGKVAWVASKEGEPENGTIVTVKKMMSKNTPLLTRKRFCGQGKITKETVFGHNTARQEGYFPLKSSDKRLCDVTKYGGTTMISTGYFFLVESEKKGKRIRTIETAPLYMVKEFEKNEESMKAYCENSLGLINPSIRLKKIPLYSLIKLNGYYLYLTGKSVNSLTVRNATSLKIKQENMELIKKIEKYHENQVLDKEVTNDRLNEMYFSLSQKAESTIFNLRPNGIAVALNNGQEIFTNLSKEQKCSLLYNIFQLVTINGNDADLSLIGKSKRFGAMMINKEITNNEEVILCNQSVTGIFESSIDLLTI